MARETVWKKIYRHLKEKGFDVYSQGQHEGECVSKYIVLRDGGTTVMDDVSSGVKYYEAILYVPLNAFSEVEEYAFDVKDVLKEMFPLIRPSGLETPVTIDDDVKAYTTSLEYVNYRKMFYINVE